MVILQFVLQRIKFSKFPVFAKAAGVDTDEKRAEDALARRWDRLLAEKASVSEELLSTYSGIFAASEMEGDDAHLADCIASRWVETKRICCTKELTCFMG